MSAPTMTVLMGDWVEQLRPLPAQSVHTCVTSPPYWGLRDYKVNGQLGLEKTPEEYVAKVVAGFREVYRVLRDDGTLWLNLGDSYAVNGGHSDKACNDRRGSYNLGNRPEHDEREFRARPGGSLKVKDLVGIPWLVALALRADGWYLRSDIIWHKPNPMPESVTDRPTKSHEYIFLMTKSASYYYDAEAIKEPVNGGAHRRKANGANSRMVLERAVGKERSKPNPSSGHVPGVTPKSAEPGSGIKSNSSFNAAVVDLVSDRNKRTVWTVATAPYREAHFATFPPDLIKPCILAGTSARGCCGACGAPYERVVENGEPDREHQKACGGDQDGNYSGKATKDYASAKCQDPSAVKARILKGMVHKRTVDWVATCACGAEVVPCKVLDPFFGSGTTGLVSLEAGRSCIGIDLNPEYLELADDRTNVTPGLNL